VTAPPNVRVHTGVEPNSPELLGLFDQADIFILPSQGECLSVALMEAAAAGLPVVTADVGALAEAVVPGTTGLLTPAGDRHSLASALTALIAELALRRAMGRAAHELARDRFEARQNGQAFLDLVLLALDTRPPRSAA
jgi:glycosyltransferase involved in cell wall biosynthesis